ncbi:ABC transporter permease [Dethiothermospora halolimnae]|uniref:ABC transporter permease n=1 Tax=Dethiothermospora halolimnae TaxID=3114390 RepID=UPI003CCBFC80
MRLPFKIAFRFLKSNKAQTIFIILGIAVGVSVQIFIGSLIQGLQKSLVDKTIGNSSQVTITNKKDKGLIDNYNDIIKEIKNSEDEITAISSSVTSSAFLKNNKDSYSILLRGFNLNQNNKIYDFKDKLVKGKLPKDKNEVAIGIDLIEKLNINLNDNISIFTPSGKNHNLSIVGIYDFNVANINESWLITSLETSQEVFNLGNKVTSIEMQVDDVFLADTVANNIKDILTREDIKITNWKEQNQELLSGLSGQSMSSYLIQVFVLLSVVLGIASVLAISVVQKSKQIGILKAMGIKDKTSSFVFLYQGLILGVIGSLAGILLGLGLSFAFTKFATNPDDTPIVELYINYNFIIFSGLVAILSATLAALIPAFKSSKLNPIEVIRNG